MADNLSADWEKATIDYYFITGEKKPDANFVKFFSASHKSVSKAVSKIVEISKRPCTAKEDKEYQKQLVDKAKDFINAMGNFQTESKDYVKQLEKLIETEKEKTVKKLSDDGESFQKLRTKRLRGLKMLKTRLEDYEATFALQSNDFTALAERASSIERVTRGITIGLKKGFTRALAASAAIKAMPTVKTWNAEMNDGFRSLTTALGVFKTLNKMYTEKGLQVPQNVTAVMGHTNSWVTQLGPWATGGKIKLAEGADVRAELAPAMTELKKCLNDFKAYVT